MAKVKVLGEKYGITITRPWNKKMYDHNEKISGQMKDQISKVIEKHKNDYMALKGIGKAINAYGYGSGMDIQDIYEDCIKGLDQAQNHWLHSDTWPDLLAAGHVKPLEQGFIGYDK